MGNLIFHDPSGRRSVRMRIAGGVMMVAALALAAAFFATLAFAPRLPGLTLKDPMSSRPCPPRPPTS